MKKIAIIGSGLLAKEFAERAHELRIESHCFSFNDKDIACDTADYFHKINILEMDILADSCKDIGIDGIIATTELTILPSAYVADRLGLLGNPVEVAGSLTNKFSNRRKVSEAKLIKQPLYCFYTGGEVPTIKHYPVIVKPVAAGGKRGINVVYDSESLMIAIENAFSFSRIPGVLIEEFLDGGTEYSVESLSYKGIHFIVQITEKITSGPPHCNELGHHQPALLSDDLEKKVHEAIREMLTIIGITNGACHTEIKIIGDEIFLIEINARPGGDHITYPLTELSTGYPYMSAIIWAALGDLERNPPINLKKYYSGICFITEKTAYLKPLFDTCEQYPWFYYKNQVSEEPSKILFNDEENLNYFIYYDKNERPIITQK